MEKDSKIKGLRPTLRLKKRFVLIEIESKEKLEFKKLVNNLTDEIIYYVGAIDFGKHGVWFLKERFDFENQSLVIKCSTKIKDKLVAALNLIKKLDGVRVKINVVRVSGTLKGLRVRGD